MAGGENPWILGVVLVVLAGFFGALGKLLMRYSHLQNEEHRNLINKEIDIPAKSIWFARAVWVLALLSVFLLNPALNLYAYSLASASLIAPFMGIKLAWHLFLAPCILSEKVVNGDFVGAFMMFVGIGMVAAGADHGDVPYTYNDLAALYNPSDPENIGFYVFVAGATAFGLFIAGLYFRGTHYRSFAIGAAAGTLGGFQFLIKSVSELIANDTQSFTKQAGPYFVTVGAIIVSVGGIVLLNYGLKHYAAIVIVPVYQCFICVAGALSGMAYFHEGKRMENWQFALYFSGMVLLLIGVYIIFYTRQTNDPEKQRTEQPITELNVLEAIPKSSAISQPVNIHNATSSPVQ